LLERGGKVRTMTLPDRQKETVQPVIKQHIQAGAALYSVERFHLFRYLDEQSFRFNNREDIGDQGRFELAMCNVADKRLTYKELIGVGAATSH
jgi:hypothetical protein